MLGWESWGQKLAHPLSLNGARLGAALRAGMATRAHRTVSRPLVDSGISGLISGWGLLLPHPV